MELSKKEKTNNIVAKALKLLSELSTPSHLRKESSLSISRDNCGNWSKSQSKVLKTGRFLSSDPEVLKDFKGKISAIISESPESKEILSSLSNPSTAIGEGDKFLTIETLNEVFGDSTDAKVEHTQGQVIFIDVWATWCGPCQDPMQHNKEIKEKYGAKWGDQVRIICISLDDTKDEALKRINERKWNKLEHYHVEGGWNDEHNLLQNYQVRGIPHGILINQEGKVVWVGNPGTVKMEEKIENLLNGKGDAGIPQDAYKKLKGFLSGEFLKSNESKKQGAFTFNISLKKNVSFDSEGKRVSVAYERPTLEVKGKKKDEALIRETVGEITKVFSSDVVQVKEDIVDNKAEKLGALTLIRDALKANDLPLVDIEWKKASYLGYWGEIELESSNEINPKTNLKPSPEIIEKVTNFTKNFPDYLAKATQVQKDWLRRFKLKSKVEVGDTFVGFDVEDAHSEQSLRLEHKQGEVLLVDFWATWCGPCQGPMGHNQTMLTKNKEKWGDKVRIVGVSRDRSKEDLLKRVNSQGWTSVQHFFLGGGPHPAMTLYGVQGIPHVVLVDQTGKIVFADHPMSCELEDEINNLLEGKSFVGKSDEGDKAPNEISFDVGKKLLKALSGQFKQELTSFVSNLKYTPKLSANISTSQVFNLESLTSTSSQAEKLNVNIEVRESDLAALEKIIEGLTASVGSDSLVKTIKGHKLVSVSLGAECNSCKAPLTPQSPQFYCRECNIHFCDTCADKLDDTKTGNAKLIHPHNLAYINVSSDEGLKDIEEFRFGKNLQHEKDVQDFGGCSCDICGESPSGGPRYICLNCKPGPALNGGWVDICYRCINNWRTKPRDSEENKKFAETLKERHGHDENSHILLRIYFGTSQNYRNF